MSRWTIHIEQSRSFWNGSATTLCGLTITKVKTSGWFLTVTCPACKAIEQATKTAEKTQRKSKGGWW